MNNRFDAIVIGAGAMGSAAAYYLSKRGQRALLLEQFELDHRKGSSYGYSRIIRYSYDNLKYVELMKDTFPLWFALQEALGETLYFKTGGIDFGPRADDTLRATIKAVQAGDISHELLSAEDGHRRFPQFRFDDDFQVLFQPDSGYIRASASVRGHVKLARRHGAEILERSPVDDIRVHSDSVEVMAGGQRYSAGKLIVTAGSWAKSMLRLTGLELPPCVAGAALRTGAGAMASPDSSSRIVSKAVSLSSTTPPASPLAVKLSVTLTSSPTSALGSDVTVNGCVSPASPSKVRVVGDRK